MKTSFFLFKQIIKELSFKKTEYTIATILVTVLFLCSFYLLFFARSQPNTTTSPPPQKEGQIIAKIAPNTSETQINSLYLDIRKWAEISEIEFLFSKEVQSKYNNLPPELAPDSNFFLLKPTNEDKKDELVSKLEQQTLISNAGIVGANFSDNLSFVFPPWVKAFSLGGVIIFAVLVLLLTQRVIRSVAQSWDGELELLKYSGVRIRIVKAPFISLGVLSGLLGAALGIGLLYGFTTWAGETLWAKQSLPAISKSPFIMGLALWSILLGPFLGFLGVLFGIETIDDKWQGKPLE